MSKYSNSLIIVESPSKAKTIGNYLNSKNVIASYGHIRNLPGKNGSVLPNEGFKMLWEDNQTNQHHIKNIVSKAKQINKENGNILIATDYDREGEGIARHIFNLLKENKISCPIKRIKFQEITKQKILDSIENPVDIDQDMVESYFARLSLDYLIGFHLSPILWKKAKGCKSAGRVQSAVLRAIIEREVEILEFNPEKYWTLGAQININGNNYQATLHKYQGNVVDKIFSEELKTEILEKLASEEYKVGSIEKKRTNQSPYPPFTTSTLHQEASLKLGWKASKTSKAAQTLYEGVEINGSINGLITYMRTDSVRMSEDAIKDCRKLITTNYGSEYSNSVMYKNKSDLAQDAHECIRPTDFKILPSELKIDKDLQKLYEIIWKRAVASQMSSAQYDITNIFVQSESGSWKIHGRKQIFDGFLKVYDEMVKNKDALLKNCSEGEPAKIVSIKPEEHTTQPKPHFSEATIIKHMDSAGIGRPSTYASTINTLVARNYIKIESKKIIPTSIAWIAVGFLSLFCPEYIQDDFTSNTETNLDSISNGKLHWQEFINEFWNKFTQMLNYMSNINPKEAIEKIGEKYPIFFFKKSGDNMCPECKDGKKVLCTTKDGPFIGCSNYPKCGVAVSLSRDDSILVGLDTDSGEEIRVKEGKYGKYLHWKDINKSIALPESIAKQITVPLAMKLKKFPIHVGDHPHTQKPIKIGISRYGMYILYNSIYISYQDKNLDLDNINLNNIIKIIGASKKVKAEESNS